MLENPDYSSTAPAVPPLTRSVVCLNPERPRKLYRAGKGRYRDQKNATIPAQNLKAATDVEHSELLARIQVGGGLSGAIFGAGLVACLALRAFRRKTVVQDINGPPAESWLYGARPSKNHISLSTPPGNMLQLMFPPSFGSYDFLWQERYGLLYRFKGCFGENRLMVSDSTALQHILHNPTLFMHGPIIDNAAHLLEGSKSIVTIHDPIQHKRVRSVLNIGFTAGVIRGYEPLIRELAMDLVEKWQQIPAQRGSINVSPDLSVITLGIIARVALGRTLKDLGEELVQNNFESVELATAQTPTHLLIDAVAAHLPVPFLRATLYLPGQAMATVRKGRMLADQLGWDVISEKMEAVKRGLDVSGDFFGQLVGGRDSVSKTASLDEIVGQTAVLLIAGQDTTASAMAFSLVHLAKDQNLQESLRQEIYSQSDDIKYDNMLLLNAVVKETLRMYPAEAMTERIALQDTVLPLGASITTISGQSLNAIPIEKGQILIVNSGGYQRQSPRWGPDPHVFRPARWLDGSVPAMKDGIGVYSNLLTFLSGNHTCLGWRLAILEMQVILATLVSKFSFSLPEGEEEQVIPHFQSTVIPVLPNGKKGALLCISPIS
uniref:Cytochrome P450 n=1 Tax=Mycena chlorophos TaxID=658473 RepID=A0ABQ0LA83_MYCCL|nr:cytochrome P450 [Mycena chlorophos]